MIDSEKTIFELAVPLDPAVLEEYISLLCGRYDFLCRECLGESVLGRPIPMLRLGNGPARFVYVGAHHGMEWMTAALLLRFVNEYCELYRRSGRIYNLSLSYLFSVASIYIVPMLNPDGVEIAVNGNGSDPLSDRRLRQNGGSPDFSRWQANARGVDLNHNYDCGFAEYKELEAEAGIFDGAPTRYSGQEPESEPETSALCRFLRYHGNIRMLLTLHTQGEEIFAGAADSIPRARAIGRVLEGLTGYRMATPEGAPAYGGLTDWFTTAFSRPAYTLECGRGENPLPLDDFFPIYTRVRELFFVFPVIR